MVRTEIVTPAADKALATLADVKAELKIEGTANDATLTRYIAAASAAVSELCGRVFPVETIRDTIFGSTVCAIKEIDLSRRPVVSVDTVTEAGVSLTAGTDFYLDAPRGRLIRIDANGRPALWKSADIVATFDAGFEEIPADVAEAVIRLVSLRWFLRGRDPMLRSETMEGVGQLQYWVASGGENAIPPEVRSMLQPYIVVDLV